MSLFQSKLPLLSLALLASKRGLGRQTVDVTTRFFTKMPGAGQVAGGADAVRF